jgi:hypothetical protein
MILACYRLAVVGSILQADYASARGIVAMSQVGDAVDGAGLRDGDPYLFGLLPALQWLDCLLDRAVGAAQTAYGPDAATDIFRGLHISADDVARLLPRAPGVPTLSIAGTDPPERASVPVTAGSRLAWLEGAFGLTRFDVALALIALAPELDLRYHRLYAYLQDDITRRRPSVDLALNLLCPTAAAKLAGRAHFAADAPLLRHGLLHLVPEPNDLRPPLLAHYLTLDEQIVRLLLGPAGLDSRLATCSQLVRPT